MTVKTLAQEWDLLESLVLVGKDDAVLRQEMRRSFYAGAMVILLDAIELADKKISEEEAADMLQGLYDEAHLFFSEDVLASQEQSH